MGREPAIEGVDLHDHRVIPVTFLNGEGVPADPTYVYVVVQRPDGTEYVGGWANPEVGRYEVALTFDMPGRWNISFQGEGAVHETRERSVVVRRPRVKTRGAP
jgi:hypothetical protein